MNANKFALALVAATLSANVLFAAPRIRVICDNDFGGDPDGLFQLAQQVLSPTCEVRGIICSNNHRGGYYKPFSAENAELQARELLKLLGIDGIKIVRSIEGEIESLETPGENAGADLIVEEAMRDDTRPLYVLCGGGLSAIATAWLKEPRIAERLTLVWIGGREYPEDVRTECQARAEYNWRIDPKATQVVFNKSNLRLWQIPRVTYCQTMVSQAELETQLTGNAGKWLVNKLYGTLNPGSSETYKLGDSPLVLVTALQAPWQNEIQSCEYVYRKAPIITDEGSYEPNPDGRTIRVITKVDTRLMFGDMFAKLKNR